MATLLASALVDDAQGCTLLAQAIHAEGGVGRPALTDPDVMVDTLARLRVSDDDRGEIYDRLVRAFVVDLDVLGEVIAQSLPIGRAEGGQASAARIIRPAARAVSRRLRPLLRPVAA